MKRGRKQMKMKCHCGEKMTPKRRAFGVMPRTVGGTLSAVLLVLMPKCPICLAAYVSVATGVGIGLMTAKYLRMGLIVVCVASLVWVSVPLWRRWIAVLLRRWIGHHN
jgi:hypothetical protein